MEMVMQQRAFDVGLGSVTDSPTRIVGYAAVFNQISYGEMVAPGAFTKTLAEARDIKAYWGHDRNQVLARTSNGTLELGEDDAGLLVTIHPNLDTTWGRDALASVQRGDVSQMSFGFRPVKAEETEIAGKSVIVLREIALKEVSPVSEPWYPGTTAEARALAGDDVEEATTAEPEVNHSAAGASVENVPETEPDSNHSDAGKQHRERRIRRLRVQKGRRESAGKHAAVMEVVTE